MDFVVVGLGIGTLAILVGVAMFAWVAGGWERAASRATLPEDATYGYAMAAMRRGAGQALIGAGVAVLIATIGALAGSLDDQTGAFFVTTAVSVAACGLLVWAYLYRTRNPLPPRRRSLPETPGEGEPVAARRSAVPSLSFRPTTERSVADAGEEPHSGLAEEVPIAPREAEAAALVIDAPADAPADPMPLAAEELPLNDEDGASERSAPASELLPAPASAGEPASTAEDETADEATAQEAREQAKPGMNGADEAPFALSELKEEWEARRGRKT